MRSAPGATTPILRLWDQHLVPYWPHLSPGCEASTWYHTEHTSGCETSTWYHTDHTYPQAVRPAPGTILTTPILRLCPAPGTILTTPIPRLWGQHLVPYWPHLSSDCVQHLVPYWPHLSSDCESSTWYHTEHTYPQTVSPAPGTILTTPILRLWVQHLVPYWPHLSSGYPQPITLNDHHIEQYFWK